MSLNATNRVTCFHSYTFSTAIIHPAMNIVSTQSCLFTHLLSFFFSLSRPVFLSRTHKPFLSLLPHRTFSLSWKPFTQPPVLPFIGRRQVRSGLLPAIQFTDRVTDLHIKQKTDLYRAAFYRSATLCFRKWTDPLNKVREPQEAQPRGEEARPTSSPDTRRAGASFCSHVLGFVSLFCCLFSCLVF